MSKPRFAALAVVSATAVLAAGCGGAGADGEGDPATAAPADALFYAELVVRPEGAQREDALDAAGKVLVTDDPEARIRELMREAFEDTGEDFDYDRDVEPWLGERVGFWLRPSEEKDNFGVLLLAATDTEKARESIEASLRRAGEPLTERSHRGTDYLVNDEGVAAGIVGDFVALGREPDYKKTIDAVEGDSLAETDEYADPVGALEDERLAHFWVDTPGMIEVARKMDPEAAAEIDQASALVPLDRVPPIAGSFAADGERLAVEAQVRSEGGKGLGPLLGGGSTPLLRELPGDSWAAMGSADVGESLEQTINGVAGPIGGVAIRREAQRRFGLDLDRDLLDWIGDVAYFTRDPGGDRLNGGIVIQPTDEDRAADAFGRIVGAIQVATRVRARPVSVAGADQAFEFAYPGFPVPIVFARGSGLVVLTTGRDAAEAALGKGDRLGDSELYAEAEELVGMEPGFLVSVPAVAELFETYGDPAEFRAAQPYLDAFTVVAAGLTADDDEATARLAAGLK